MRLYWLLSTFAAGLILSQLGPSPTASITIVAALGAIALAALPGLLLIRRRLNWDLMDLVLWTIS